VPYHHAPALIGCRCYARLVSKNTCRPRTLRSVVDLGRLALWVSESDHWMLVLRGDGTFW